MPLRLRVSVAFAISMGLAIVLGGAEQSAPAAETGPKVGESIDLLKQIDLKKHVLAGQWRMEEGALVSPADTKIAKVVLPGVVPEAYRLSILAERLVPGDGIDFVFVIGGRQVALLVDGKKATFVALHMVGTGASIRTYERLGGPVFKDGQPARIDISVNRTTLRVVCGGKSIFNRQVNPQDLSLFGPQWAGLPADCLAVGTYTSSFRLKKVELTPLTPQNTPPATAKAPASIDLLKQIDVKKDVLAGEWRAEQGTLVSDPGKVARLVLPSAVPASYRLSLVAERIGGQRGLSILLTMGSRATEVVFEGYNKMVTGLNLVDGRTPDRNLTGYRHPISPAGKPSTIDVVVEGDRIGVVCDGKLVIAWRGDEKRLSVNPRSWPDRPADRLALASWSTSFRLSKIELTPISAAAAAPVAAGSVAPDAAKLGRSVVLIEHGSRRGSGFVVGKDLVATNAHVIRGTFAEDIKVLFPEGDRSPVVVRRVVWENEGRDLALLELSTDAPPMRVAPKHEFRQGEAVTLIGNPSVGSGIVARNTISQAQLAAQVRIGKHDFYQIAGDVNPGSSGGPVLDRSGSVVAVVAMKATDRGAAALHQALAKVDDTFAAYFGGRRAEGAAFAIPAPALADAMAQVAQRPAAYPEQMNAEHAARTLCYRLMTLASVALAETQANVPASMRQQAAAGSGVGSASGPRRPAPDKRRRLPLLAPEEAQRLARELQSPPVQAMKENCSKDLAAQFQKAQRNEYLEEVARRDLEQLYRLVSQVRRYAEKPQTDYFVHSAKVLGFVGDLKTIVKRLEEQLGIQQQ
jgi:S1-C subfamily serine protease